MTAPAWGNMHFVDFQQKFRSTLLQSVGLNFKGTNDVRRGHHRLREARVTDTAQLLSDLDAPIITLLSGCHPLPPATTHNFTATAMSGAIWLRQYVVPPGFDGHRTKRHHEADVTEPFL